MEKIPKVAILIRLRPNAKELLDKACRELQRSRSILIDQLITEVLTREYADLHSRLDDLVARQSA
jgi:predicted transcriptional regulator